MAKKGNSSLLKKEKKIDILYSGLRKQIMILYNFFCYADPDPSFLKWIRICNTVITQG